MADYNFASLSFSICHSNQECSRLWHSFISLLCYIYGALSNIESSNIYILQNVFFLGDGPFTLFAPTNEAFAKLPAGVLANLLKNKTALADVLTYHVVSGTFYSAGLTNGMSATTVEGKPVTITISGGLFNIYKIQGHKKRIGLFAQTLPTQKKAAYSNSFIVLIWRSFFLIR